MQRLQLVNPIIPLVETLPGGLVIGNQLTLIGSTHLNASRFSINLQCGPSVSPRADVALHISPDFSRNVIIRNSIQNYVWGVEESLGGMPLAQGRPFQIDITCEASRFVMVFDHQTVFYTNHRMPSNHISHLAIDGEVMLNEIRLSASPSSMPYAAAPPYLGTAPRYPGAPPPYGSAPMAPGPYPTQPGSVPYPPGAAGGAYVQPNHNKGVIGSMLGTGVVGAAISARSVNPKKIMKHQKKMAKKALKYGVPIAGAGVGAYALGKAMGHGHHHYHHKHHRKSSSSSSSSSSD